MTRYTVNPTRRSLRTTAQNLGRADTDLLHVGAWYSRHDDPMSVSDTVPPSPGDRFLFASYKGRNSWHRLDPGRSQPGGHQEDADDAGLAGRELQGISLERREGRTEMSRSGRLCETSFPGRGPGSGLCISGVLEGQVGRSTGRFCLVLLYHDTRNSQLE